MGGRPIYTYDISIPSCLFCWGKINAIRELFCLSREGGFGLNRNGKSSPSLPDLGFTHIAGCLLVRHSKTLPMLAWELPIAGDGHGISFSSLRSQWDYPYPAQTERGAGQSHSSSQLPVVTGIRLPRVGCSCPHGSILARGWIWAEQGWIWAEQECLGLYLHSRGRLWRSSAVVLPPISHPVAAVWVAAGSGRCHSQCCCGRLWCSEHLAMQSPGQGQKARRLSHSCRQWGLQQLGRTGCGHTGDWNSQLETL